MSKGSAGDQLTNLTDIMHRFIIKFEFDPVLMRHNVASQGRDETITKLDIAEKVFSWGFCASDVMWRL